MAQPGHHYESRPWHLLIIDFAGATTMHGVRFLVEPTKFLIRRFATTHVFIRATLASAGILAVVVCLSVCLSVTSRCSIETAKRSITGITAHDRAGSLVFCCRKSRQNSNGVTRNRGAKCRWDRLNAGEVAENWLCSTRSVVN